MSWTQLDSDPQCYQTKETRNADQGKKGKAIRRSLESIPGSAEEDKQQISEVDAIWLKALWAIHDALNL